MNQNNAIGARQRAVVVAGLAGLIAVGTIASVAAFGGRADETSAPPSTAAPTKAPVATPIASEAPVETPEPTDGGLDAIPFHVDLLNETGADVYVDIVDQSGTLVDAVSGTPGHGMTTEPYTLGVENIDERTLRLSWTDFPIDNALALYIDETGRRFVLVQPEPTGDTDAIGVGRELILTFSEPISAADVDAFLQDGLDTSGN